MTTKNYPIVQFRPDARLHKQLEARRDESVESLGSVARRDLERYYDLVQQGLRELQNLFSSTEVGWMLRCYEHFDKQDEGEWTDIEVNDAWGEIMLEASIDDEENGWNCDDGPGPLWEEACCLPDTIEKLKLIQRLALSDLLEQWSKQEGQHPPTADQLKKKGLQTTDYVPPRERIRKI